MWTEWVNRASEAIPGSNDALRNVLEKNRLIFNDEHEVGDKVDYHCARLIANAIRKRTKLMISLPDLKPHRPAFLFATALIRDFLDSYRQPTDNKRPVLYFGANIGIREQLQKTSIKGLGINLSEVFSQRDIRRNAGIESTKIASKTVVNALPTVITVYSPADPIQVLNAYSPSWIAIDCSDSKSVPWLQPLLKEAARIGISIIAWSQNPLSECLTVFESFSDTFIWPPNIQQPMINSLGALLYSYENINLYPYILGGNTVNQFSSMQFNARKLLSQVTQETNNKSRLVQDAVTIHWKLYNSLESIGVPVDFYEAESPRFWGLTSLQKIFDACDHFINAIYYSDKCTAEKLENVMVTLKKSYSILDNSNCALWDACVNYCLEDSKNDDRLLVFSNDNRKRLFLYAMLARYNTTEDDLKSMSVRVNSLNGIRRSIHNFTEKPQILTPMIVGLPSNYITPQLYFVLIQSKVSIMLYPHQYPILVNRQIEWSKKLGSNLNHNIKTLANLSSLSIPDTQKPTIDERIILQAPTEMNIETTRKINRSSDYVVWEPQDQVVEVTNLLQPDEESEEDLIINDQLETSPQASTEQPQDIWCQQAIKVCFDQEWFSFFDINDLINVIYEKGLVQKFIRSLRKDDNVLMIYGQHRQSIYDLIISRIHKHPSIELHIAMIQHWQEDLRVAYRQWRSKSVSREEYRLYGLHDLDGLLRRMKALGSQLVSTETINTWLKGTILCPHNQGDLKRIAEVLDIGFVKDYYKTIFKAANRLRGLHRGLSNRLNRWLMDQASGITHKNEDDLIDAELGLTFSDIRNSLLILCVKSIETIQGPFLRNTLGQLQKGDVE